ncbi:MAG: hypothetical protein IT196_06015 [Acidimicrobiales bacterium]|nr:hypothetical protein [Acidimicrobiales bacterium]
MGLFDGTAVELALLDRRGVIIAVNDAWERFCAANGGDRTRCGVGADYLAACDAAGADPAASAVAAAIRAALRDELPRAAMIELPCHGPAEPRWFDVLVATRYGPSPREGASAELRGATVLLAPSARRGLGTVDAATVAHDIANTLTIVGARAEQLASGGDERSRRAAAAAIERAILHARVLLDELAMPRPPEAQALDIGATVRRLEPLLRDFAGDRCTVLLDLADELPTVCIDPLQFTQALANLVGNARQAMIGGGALRISARALPDGTAASAGEQRIVPGPRTGPVVQVAVADQGSGVDPAVLPRIFERSFSTRRVGAGLGLAVVAEIMSAAGGSVSVRSRPGRGSTFTLWFPATGG